MEKTSMNENSQHIGANVSPLGAGGDFEKQIDHGNSKPDRTTQRIVTVKPRLRQTAVSRRIFNKLIQLILFVYLLGHSNQFYFQALL